MKLCNTTHNIVSQSRVTLRSCYKTGVDFDKICVYCGKCYVHSDTCVSVVVKIKCVNSGNINDICDKLNFITNTHLQQLTHISSKLIQILQFLTPSTGQ